MEFLVDAAAGPPDRPGDGLTRGET